MSKARQLFRLHLALAAAGVLAAVGALLVGLQGLEFVRPPLGQLQSACHRLVPDLGLGQMVLLLLPLLGGLVLWRAVLVGARQLHAHRNFMRRLPRWKAARVLGYEVRLLDDSSPRAFCAGLRSPAIYLSTGALEQLGEAELAAVLEHERHHQLRHDPLRIWAARTSAEALFFLPSLRAAGERYAALAELAADEAAMRRVGRPPLAAALLRMGQVHAAGAVGVAAERVDHLTGTPPRWRLSAAGFFSSLLIAAVLLALTVTAAAFLAGARLNLLLVLAQTCMPLMTAGAVLALAWTAHLLRPLLPLPRA